MLECTPNLESCLNDHSQVIVELAKELEKAGLITKDQLQSLFHIIHDIPAASILISMITTKVYCNSENFTIFFDVLKKDESTYGHILAKMKGKGVFAINNGSSWYHKCTLHVHSPNLYQACPTSLATID